MYHHKIQKTSLLHVACRCVSILLLLLVTATTAAKEGNMTQKEFDHQAYLLRTDLVHNHTYDYANIAKADSLYAASKARGSEIGVLYALQIKYYALAGNDMEKEFYETVDEFLKIAKEKEYFDEYFDATSAKTQFLMGHEEYAKCMSQAKEMLTMAQKARNYSGLYESNMLIGQIYKHMSAWLIAENYFKKSIDAVYKIEGNDSIPYCLLYRELAECNVGMENHGKAIEYALKAMQWAPYDTYRIFCEWTYLSAVYCSGDYKRLLKEYAKSRLSKKSVRDNLDMAMNVKLEAMLLVANHKYDEAIRIIKKLPEKDTYNMLSNVYYKKGDYKQAIDNLQRHQAITDSMEMNMLQNELSEMEVSLGNATLKYEAEQASSRMRLVLVISMGLIFTIIMCFMIYILRRRRMRNRQLLAANRAVELKNAELIEANLATEKALAAAKKANAMRLHFIENMTHEIRTPLNAISGFTQVLTSGDVNTQGEEAAEIRDIIMRNTNNLTQILDNIIEISNYDSATVDVNIEENTVRNIIETALHSVLHNSKSEKVRLSITESDILDSVIKTDVSLVSKALCQVISNAFKFTQEGTVTIAAEKTEGKVCLSVTDTGKGVPASEAERIFERFSKLDEFVPGTGLGLSLCRAMLKIIGGSVCLDTTHQAPGSRFVITLPLGA